MKNYYGRNILVTFAPFVGNRICVIYQKSLFLASLGILSGALMLSVFVVFGENGAIESIISTMATNVGDSYNFALLIFLVLLGMLVQLMTKAGGTVAYGNWAGSKIKSQRQALFATSALGVMIFVDDYFNCLTVGTIMSPLLTDSTFAFSPRLAYIMTPTAAPVCNY